MQLSSSPCDVWKDAAHFDEETFQFETMSDSFSPKSLCVSSAHWNSDGLCHKIRSVQYKGILVALLWFCIRFPFESKSFIKVLFLVFSVHTRTFYSWLLRITFAAGKLRHTHCRIKGGALLFTWPTWIFLILWYSEQEPCGYNLLWG